MPLRVEFQLQYGEVGLSWKAGHFLRKAPLHRRISLRPNSSIT
jgi:hypothetical protein